MIKCSKVERFQENILRNTKNMKWLIILVMFLFNNG